LEQQLREPQELDLRWLALGLRFLLRRMPKETGKWVVRHVPGPGEEIMQKGMPRTGTERT
jgi:hypothetical protein